METKPRLDTDAEFAWPQREALDVDEPRRPLNRAKEAIGVRIRRVARDRPPRLAARRRLRHGRRSDFEVPQTRFRRDLRDERCILHRCCAVGKDARQGLKVAIENLTFLGEGSRGAHLSGGEDEEKQRTHAFGRGL